MPPASGMTRGCGKWFRSVLSTSSRRCRIRRMMSLVAPRRCGSAAVPSSKARSRFFWLAITTNTPEIRARRRGAPRGWLGDRSDDLPPSPAQDAVFGMPACTDVAGGWNAPSRCASSGCTTSRGFVVHVLLIFAWLLPASVKTGVCPGTRRLSVSSSRATSPPLTPLMTASSSCEFQSPGRWPLRPPVPVLPPC